MRELLPTIAAAVTPLILLAILLVGPTLGLVEWQPPILWTTEFGNIGPNIQNQLTSITTDKTGLYAAGSLETYSTATGYSSYSFLNRYDPNGGQVWSQNLGNSVVFGIGAGADGVYVARSNGSAYVVQKYDLSGSPIWADQLGTLTIYASPISVGGTGVYVTGFGPQNPNNTTPLLVRAYDFNGSSVWTNALANVNYGGASRVYADSSGVYVTESDGVNPVDSHAFVSRYDINGALQWTRQFDEPGFTCWCGTNGISGDASGIYVLGSTRNALPGQSLVGHTDTFIRKYDSKGNALWTIEFLAPYSTGASDEHISANPSGIFLLVFGSMLRYDSNGNRVWSIPLHQTTGALSVGENNVYVGGPWGSDPGRKAFAEAYDVSSSLVLFGVNPPFSFVIAGLLASAAALSVLWLRKGWKKKVRRATQRPLVRTSRDLVTL